MADIEKIQVTLSPEPPFPPSSDLGKGYSYSKRHLELPQLQHATRNVPVHVSSSVSMSQSTSLDDTTTLSNTNQSQDGGFRAYLSVFGAFMALLSTFGHMNSFGTYQAWYSANELRHLSPSTISWIGSLQLWVFFFSGGFIGQLFDKFGPTWLMLSGTIIYVFSIMMTSVSTKLYQYLLAQGALFGLGVGLLFYPSLASVSTYFTKYRATALGIAAAGSSIGGYDSFNPMCPVDISATIQAVSFTQSCFNTFLYVWDLAGAFAYLGSRTDLRIGLKTFSDLRYVLLAIGSCLVALGLFIPFFYIVPYTSQLPIHTLPSSQTEPQPTSTILVLAILNAGGILGRILPALISDTLGRFNLLIPSALFSGVSTLTLWFVLARNTGTAMAFAAVYGFFSGAFISLITPCVAQISEPGLIGVRIGALYSVISFP
ncbi:hypothetical protein H0H92_013771 [Tricholoma furcatifolium]|nr:hypothetical protein H0H92_013771 [Tricholoma furcatifolium]